MDNLKKTLRLLTPAAIMATPIMSALAQANLPPGVPNGSPITLNEIINLINRFMQVITQLGVVVGVIYIVIGGIQYITAGADDKKVEAARKRVLNGVIGVAIVLGVGVLIQTAAAVVNRSALSL